MRHLRRILIVLVCLVGRTASAEESMEDNTGIPSTVLPSIVGNVDIDEHLGQPIDRSLAFTNMNGKRVRLSEYFSDGKPVLLVLAYYRCPMLCGLVLNGVVEGLKKFDWKLGNQYRVLTISFDPRDTQESAAQKRESTLSALGEVAQTKEWPFLIGEESKSQALADNLGFRFAYDPRTDQYAHPAAIFALTADGRISRYLYGVQFSTRDLRLALLEASEGKIGTIVDRILMTCYRFDPTSRKYGPFIFGFMRLGAIVILFTVSTVLLLLWRGERLRRLSETRGGDFHERRPQL
jgi:protein SCO1